MGGFDRQWLDLTMSDTDFGEGELKENRFPGLGAVAWEPHRKSFKRGARRHSRFGMDPELVRTWAQLLG